MPNESYETTLLATNSSEQNTLLSPRNISTFAEIVAVCNKNGPITVRLYVQIFIVILGLPANTVLLWMLVKNRKTMTPSEVFRSQYCSNLCAVLRYSAIGYQFADHKSKVRTSNALCTSFFHALLLWLPTSADLHVLRALRGCSTPCALHQLGKWEYRVACSAIIWFLTCITAGFMFVYTLANMALVLSFILDVLFVVMTVCLVCIMSVLCKKGPGDGDQNNSSIKKKALKNVVAVLVPSTIIYMPMLALSPIILAIHILLQNGSHMAICYIILLFAVLPNAGVFIGPMFYMSRVWRMLRSRNNESGNTSMTTAVQRM